jgi:hypothetical protein
MAKSTDDSLKSQRKQFWKYVVTFRTRNSISLQLEVGGKYLIEPIEVVDEFSKHSQSVYKSPCPVVFPTHSSSSEFYSLAPVSDSNAFKANKRLRPSKSFGVDDVSGFIIKVCTDICTCS